MKEHARVPRPPTGTIPRLSKLPDALAPTGALVQMREDLRNDPLELPLEGAHPRPRLGEHPGRVRAPEGRPRPAVLAHAGGEANRAGLAVHPRPRHPSSFPCRTASRRHRFSIANSRL